MKKTTYINHHPIHHSVAAIIQRDGQKLFIERATYPKAWAHPAGHIDHNDQSLEAAITRELQEELSLALTCTERTRDGIYAYKCNDNVLLHRYTTFDACAEGDVQPNPREIRSFRWQFGHPSNLTPYWHHHYADQPGHLIYVVGPSGSGKDTILKLVQQKLKKLPVRFLQRHVTRAANEFENHIPVTEGEFHSTAYALSWYRRGIYFGVPKFSLELQSNATVIVNGSREHLTEMKQQFPHATTIGLTSTKENRAARLQERNRDPDITKRVNDDIIPQVDILIRNDDTLETAVDSLANAILHIRKL